MRENEERRRRFEALVAEVHDPLARYLARRAPRDDVDDVLGEVLLTLWRRLDDIPGAAAVPWCYGVARRTLANHLRSNQRRLQLVRRIETQPPLAFDAEGSAEHPMLAAALATLSHAEQEVIALWAWEELEPREIARVLETTPNAVSLRLSRARKKLAQEISRQNGTGAGQPGDRHTGATT